MTATGRRRRVPLESRRQVVDLFLSGESTSGIARRLHVSRAWVYAYLREATTNPLRSAEQRDALRAQITLSCRGGRRPLDPVKREMCLALLAAGSTITQAARSVGISRASAWALRRGTA